jgi:hypothetical protein
MDKPMREAAPNFSQPIRQIVTMCIVVALVLIGATFSWTRLSVVFYANPYLNSAIIVVFAIGVIACFAQAIQISSSVRWIVDFTSNVPGHDEVRVPQLLAPLASLLRSRGARSQISGTAGTNILDSVATRIDEARDFTRYLTNLLIFFGLLGTFWGLATTVPAVVETIRSLAPKEGETAAQVFAKLMGGLQTQLGGMGMAFSSSLLGLAGSLVIGLLELFASHGQNRFYRELEEWLSSITRIGFAGADGEGGFDQGVLMGVLDHMAEQMDALQKLFVQTEAGRAETDGQIGQLVAAVGHLTTRLEARTGEDTTTALERIADAQDKVADAQQRVIDALDRNVARQERIADGIERNSDRQDRVVHGQERLIASLDGRGEAAGEHTDAESRMRLRSIDVQLLRILEEISAGRQESITDLRGDLAALTAAIRQLSRGGVAPTGRG